MWSRDVHRAAGAQQPVKLFHCAHHVCYVLDNMHRANFIEAAVAKRIRKAIEIADYVRRRVRVPVNPDRTRILVYTAADVKDARFPDVAPAVSECRHSSSVSTAKSA